MKKFSLVGLVLGGVLGIIAGLLAGGWIFWLGVGLALGVVIGSAQARHGRMQRSSIEAGNLNS
jgi:hypothetical protein